MDELEQLAKLDQEYQTQRTALLEVAKRQWLDKINPLIEQGKTLGFNYGPLTTEADDKPAADEKRNRRSATDIDTLKQNILAYIKTNPEGMTGRTIYDHFKVTDTNDEQNYGTYISKLVKDGYLKKITKGSDGKNLAKNAIKYEWLKDMAKAS